MGHTKISKLLLERPGIRVKSRDICQAFQPQNMGLIRLVLEKGAHDINNSFWNPLCHAVEEGNLEAIQILLSHPNIDPNINSPLVHAFIRSNKEEIIRLLFSHPLTDWKALMNSTLQEDIADCSRSSSKLEGQLIELVTAVKNLALPQEPPRSVVAKTRIPLPGVRRSYYLERSTIHQVLHRQSTLRQVEVETLFLQILFETKEQNINERKEKIRALQAENAKDLQIQAEAKSLILQREELKPIILEGKTKAEEVKEMASFETSTLSSIHTEFTRVLDEIQDLPASSLNPESLQFLIRQTGFSDQVAQAFEKEKIDGSSLCFITEKDLLKKMNISDSLERKRVLYFSNRVSQQNLKWICDSLRVHVLNARAPYHLPQCEEILRHQDDIFGEVIEWSSERVIEWVRSDSSISSLADTLAPLSFTGFTLLMLQEKEIKNMDRLPIGLRGKLMTALDNLKRSHKKRDS